MSAVSVAVSAAPAPRLEVAPVEAPAPQAPQASRGVLDGRWAPGVLGLITAALQWLVWRSFRGVPAIADEASYVLQAKLFAHFRWTAPPPPIRAFFEESHVLVSPVIASKYPPGHALLLAVGAFFNAPGLVPVVLTGLTGALLFTLARRVSNAPIALLSWFFWTCAPFAEGIRPSYFSEVTTTATWLLGWWALLQWRDDGRTRWLVLLSVATAWCAITRPVTAVAYAIPTGAITLIMIGRRRAWRAAMIALAAGLVVISLLPLWSWRTLGSVKTSPYVAYNQTYVPYEQLGFGDNGGRSPKWMPPDLYMQLAGLANLHAAYTPRAVPRQLLHRVRYTFDGFLTGSTWSAILTAFIPIGLFVGGLEGAIAAGAVLALFAVYLSYAHAPEWMIYYYEAIPMLCFFGALGVARALDFLGGRRAAADTLGASAFTRRGLVAVTLVCLPFGLMTLGEKRYAKAMMTAPQTYFARGAQGLKRPAIVFVRYAPNHIIQASLIDNDPDLAHAAVWKVYDRGEAENARLRAIAPERHAYVYLESSGTFVELPK